MLTTINLGLFNIQVWGLLAAIGVLAATLLAVFRAKTVKKETIYDLVFYTVITGIIGSRLLYVIEEWQFFSNNLIDALKFWQGGLSFSGGLLFGVIAAYIYLKKHKLNLLTYLDIFAPAIVLGHFFGRIGCFLIGDHLGKLSNLPWAIMRAGELRHPVILYEIIYLGLIFIILLKLPKLKKGSLFISYILMYSFARFFNDFFRIDPTYYGLTVAQYFMLVLFFSSIIYLKNTVINQS